jgi:hypothetical protein
MTKISLKKRLVTDVKVDSNIYPYGKFYDTSKVKVPKDEDNWTGLIVYVNPQGETSRIIGSLEGYFVSDTPLIEKSAKIGALDNLLVQKTQMQDFEKKYNGKFFPFQK